MFEKFKEKAKLRKEAVAKAREGFASWLEVSKSPGWRAFQEKLDKKEEVILGKFKNDVTLTPEDLKRLQLALQVVRDIQRIPKELEDNARGQNANAQRQ